MSGARSCDEDAVRWGPFVVRRRVLSAAMQEAGYSVRDAFRAFATLRKVEEAALDRETTRRVFRAIAHGEWETAWQIAEAAA